MSFELTYCPNGKYVIDRLRQFYTQKGQNQVFCFMEVPSLTLKNFQKQHIAGYCEYPDLNERITFWDACLHERIKIQDDSIPSAYLTEMDQGLYGGLVGGKVQFICDPSTGWISSMVSPILQSWSEFEGLKFDQNNKWFHLYIRQLKIFVAKAAQRFGISHFILIDSLNFVFELFGATKTYMDLIDQPDMIHKAVDFAFDLNVKIQNTFFDIVPLLEGGTCSNFAQWVPGRIVSESIDPFQMTSDEYFEQWGREPVERIFGKFEGGILHIHSNGHHLLESISTIKGLKVIYFEDDKGAPPAFEILRKIKTHTKNIPIIIEVEFEDFCSAMNDHRLLGGVFYQVRNVPDIDSANCWMDKVRRYRE